MIQSNLHTPIFYIITPVLLIVPCCPENLAVSGISLESLMTTWMAVRGADMYEVQAVDSSNQAVLCNDTSPVCVLSNLKCNTRYNVLVSPCNEAQGCNRSCSPQTQETGKIPARTLHDCTLHSH